MNIEPHIEPDEIEEPIPPAEPPAMLNMQRQFRWMVSLAVAGFALVVWLFFNTSGTGNQVDDLIATNKAQQVLIDKLATQLDVARAQGAEVPAPEVIAAAVPEAEVSPPVQGERGDAGDPGVTGDAGIPGSTGSTGETGSVGEQGSIGPRGLPGVAGADGAPGAGGTDGSQGPPGPAGVDGAPGANGAPGQPGADGSPGPQGPPGPMPSTFVCTPSNPLDLGEPWTCTTTS